jgi:hypothetical protein
MDGHCPQNALCGTAADIALLRKSGCVVLADLAMLCALDAVVMTNGSYREQIEKPS